MSKSAGYSGTPLCKKLGIQPAFRVKTKNAPEKYMALISPIQAKVIVSTRLRANIDLFHLFTKSRKELFDEIVAGKNSIRQNGMIWVSWPKKSSKIPSEVTENTIREIALPLGLVDVKVCAVDETWSGLKLVIRKANRKT